MSDQPIPASNPPPTPAATKKKRNWRKRIRNLLLLVIVLAVVGRASVGFLLPSVLRKVAGYYGLDCTYERLELSVLSGDAGLWHVAVTPKGGGEAILRTEYCRGNISVLDLFRGRLSVWRVEADGVDALVDRNADGTIPLLKMILSKGPTAAAAAPGPAKPIDLEPPLTLDALRLTHVKAHVRDRSVTPPLDTTMVLNLRLSDVGSKIRPVRFAVDMDADPILDVCRVEGEAHADGKTIDGTIDLTVDGLRLRPVTPYLALLGIKPIANELTFRAHGHLKASHASGKPNMLAATLELANATATADGEEAAGMDHLTLDASAIDTGSVLMDKLAIDGVRLSGRRAAGGNFRFAGLEYAGLEQAALPATQPANASHAPITLPIVSLSELDVQHVKAIFRDEAVAPAVDAAILVDDFNARNLVLDPARKDAAIALSIVAHAPGLFESTKVTGSITPFAEKKNAKFLVTADGIAPVAVRTYLDAIGVESELKSAKLACDLSADVSLPAGAIAADVTLDHLKLTDNAELVSMGTVRIAGAEYQMSPAKITLKDVQISGPALSISHGADGSVHAAGFHTKAPVHVGVTQTSATAQTGAVSGSLPAIPAVEIDHLAWKDIDIGYSDETVSPVISTKLSDAGVELKDVLLDLTAGKRAAAAKPGTVHVWAKIPQVAESFSIEGNIAPEANAMACDLHVIGSGITVAALAPLLKSIGVEPTLRDGSLAAQVRAQLSQGDHGLSASLDAEGVKYADGTEELAGIDRLKVDAVEVRKDGVTIGGVQIDRPRIGVTREANGSFALMGVRLSPTLFKPKPADHQTVASAATPFSLALKTFHAKDATLSWNDLAATPQVRTTGAASFDLSDFAWGGTPQAASFHLAASMEGSLDEAIVDGKLLPSLNTPSVTLTVAAKGIRAGALASYLPPGILVPLKDGRFKTALNAGLAPNSGGGIGGHVIVSDLDFRDGDDVTPLAKLDSVKLIATRIDPAGRVFALQDISTTGVEATAERTAAGGLRALGVELRPAEMAKTPTTAKSVATMEIGSTAAPTDVAKLVAAARQAAPVMMLDHLDVGMKRFMVRDDMRPAAAPLVVSDLHLRNLNKIDLGGADAESHPPTQLRLDCTLDPLVGSVGVLVQIAPFAQQPTVLVDLTAAGIHGDGATALVPEIKQWIDGSALRDGDFHAHLESAFKVQRRGPFVVDLSPGFDADVLIKDLAFHATPGGPVLAGLGSIQSDGIHIEPANGSVHVKTLEIARPIGRIVREADGIHVIGVVVKLPAESSATTKGTAPASAHPQSTTNEPTTRPSGEIRVDQLLVSDVDFQAEDHVLAPPVVFPVDSLDVEVRNFTSLALYEDRPITFNVLATGGKVKLPKKSEGGSAVGGAIGDAAALLGGKHVESLKKEFEERELFAQASASGKIGLYPAPNGWGKTSLSGLELAGLSGAANKVGVTLTGGVFDSSVDARMPGDGSMEARTRTTFTDLALSEPPDGPIFRYLHLPAPLDTVVGVLQDSDGAINVPLTVPVKKGELNVGAAAGSAAGAFLQIVTTAIASTPLKAADAMGNLFGLGGPKTPKQEQPVELKFDAGYAALDAADVAALMPLAKRVAKEKDLQLVLRHELGGGDIKRAAARANPTVVEAQNLAAEMREQKLEAMGLRSQLAGEARAELAVGSEALAAGTLDRLREVNRQIAQQEDAMDRLYDLLRPGADRQAQRRTRAACLAYGQERIEAVKGMLLAGAPADVAERLKVMNPQFSQTPGEEGGKIVIQLIAKKK